MKKFVMVAMIVMVVQAIPPPLSDNPSVVEPRLDITERINSLLEQGLENIENPVTLEDKSLKIDSDRMFHLYLFFETPTIEGVKTNLHAHECMVNIDTHEAQVAIKGSRLTFATDHYFINGTMVDHIEMVGEGPATIMMEDMDFILRGHANFQLEPFSLQFTDVHLDLELLRWTVNFENMMPGTDLGTVFNEFFSMCGPELIDMVEGNIDDDKLLNFINSLLP